MPKNTDSAVLQHRRREAIQSALVSSALQLITGLLVLGLRWYFQMEGFWAAILCIFAVLDLGTIIPVWI